jgi:hypothetical protein
MSVEVKSFGGKQCQLQNLLEHKGKRRVLQKLTQLGSKSLLWERMRALFFDYALASMRQLLEALFYGSKKSSPNLAIDTS